jgi:hypothetical protein
MYNRWYDKYSDLKSIILLLEKVNEEYIDVIAQDFLQIIAEKYKDKFDNYMQELSNNSPPRYYRWYDRNYDLHTSIEFIKILNDNEKIELINLFIGSLTSFIKNVDNE